MDKALRSGATAVFLFAAACAASAQNGPPMSRPGSMPGLVNFALVEKGIYRGSRPWLKSDPLPLGRDLDEAPGDAPDPGAPDGLDSLASLGVVKIIDLQGGDLTSSYDRKIPDWTKTILKLEPGEAASAISAETAEGAARSPKIDVVNFSLDSLDPVTDEEAVRLDQILTALAAAADAGQPVYVHCEHGKDRTGLVVALYRIRYDHWTPEQASAEMSAMGHTGKLDRLATHDMDLSRVLAAHPELASGGP